MITILIMVVVGMLLGAHLLLCKRSQHENKVIGLVGFVISVIGLFMIILQGLLQNLLKTI